MPFENCSMGSWNFNAPSLDLMTLHSTSPHANGLQGDGGVGNGARDGGEQWNTTAGSRWKESAFSRATERTRSLIAHSPPSDNGDPCQEQLKHHIEQIKGCSVFPPPVCISFVAAFKSFSSMKQFFKWLNAWLQLINNNTFYIICPKLLSLLLQSKKSKCKIIGRPTFHWKYFCSMPCSYSRFTSVPPPTNLPSMKQRGTVLEPVISPRTAWISLPSSRWSSSITVALTLIFRNCSLAMLQ